MERTVAAVDAHEDEVLSDLEDLSADCLDAVDHLLGALETQPPALEDRCGLLDDRWELFAMRLPGCPRHRLLVAIDHRTEALPCIVLGVGQSLKRPCDMARSRATKHFGLIDPVWEPRR